MNPEMNASRAAQIFKRAKETKQMMSELPSKMSCPGGISSILVPLPKEGIAIEYVAITDGPTIERLILYRNIRHFRQAEYTPLATHSNQKGRIWHRYDKSRTITRRQY
jgi:hypothetical protein